MATNFGDKLRSWLQILCMSLSQIVILKVAFGGDMARPSRLR